MKVLKGRFFKLFNSHLPWIFLIFTFVVFFYPVIFKGKIPLPADALVGAHVPFTEDRWEAYPAGVPIKNLEISDTFSQYYPWKSFGSVVWLTGSAPLWNPYMFSGAPFLATLHSSSIYPLNLYYFVFSPENAWALLVMSQIALSLVFMFIFLRRLSLSNYSSLFGAIVFSFSGYMISLLEFVRGGQSGLWLPLLLTLGLNLFQTKKLIFLIPTAFVYFLMFTAGDFQTPLYSLILYLGLGISFAIKDKSIKILGLTLLSIVWGLLLSSVQLLPAIDLFLNSIRTSDGYLKEFNYGLLGWEKITNFIWPDFYGNVVTGNYFGTYTYHEYMAYPGIIALVFLFISLFSKKVWIEKFFWAVLITSLLFLFPNPISYLPYKLNIPALSSSFASRLLIVSGLSIAILSSFGLEKFVLQKQYKKMFVVGLGFLLVTGFVFLFLHFLSSLPQLSEAIKNNVIVSKRNLIPSILVIVPFVTLVFLGKFFKSKIYQQIFLMIILLLSLFDLLRFASKNTSFSDRDFVFPENETLSFLQKQAKPFRVVGEIPTNIFMHYELESVEGYDPIYPKLSSQWISAINNGDINSPSGRYGLVNNLDSPLLDLSNVKYFVDYKKGPFGEINKDGAYQINDEKGFELVHEQGRVGVFENLNVYERAWLTDNIKVQTDDNLLIKELSESVSNKELVIFLKSPHSQEAEIAKTEFDPVKYHRGPNKIELTYSSDSDAYIFLAESFDKDWKVYLNNIPGKILQANFAYMATFAPKGEENKLTFIYSPASFRIGKTLSFLSGGLLFSFFVFTRKFKKKV